jgi:hypothetical protein
MNQDDHAALIGKLSRSRRLVYDAVVADGPVDDLHLHELVGRGDDPGPVRARRSELTKLGLVRQAGRRQGRKLWAATPAADVEAAREGDREEGASPAPDQRAPS